MINKQFHVLYLLITLISLLLFFTASALLVKYSFDTEKNRFERNGESLYSLLNEQVKINETVIEGFAATVSAVGVRDWDEIREYARHMKLRYPHIYMFEIVEKVLHKNKNNVESYFRKNVDKNFKIKQFKYRSSRQWEDVGKKDFYMPIVFMEPFPKEFRDILGLDVSSTPFFMDSLKKTIERHLAVSTIPFTLIENKLAYLIYKPIIRYSDNNQPHDHSFNLENRYAILVVLADSLFKNQLISMPDYNITLYHSNFSFGDRAGVLYHKAGLQVSTFESYLFPRFIFEQELTNESQPLALHIEYQAGWSILNIWLLVTILLGSIVFLCVMLHYAKKYYQRQMMRQQETENLFYLANHDGLTGLANRNLLLDRLAHALKQAERSGARLAVLFMDLDDFKAINDEYGHDVGDQLLQSASERMLACIRIGDTLSRRSGDEFVLVLENVANKEKIDAVVEKIKAAFENDFVINGKNLKVGISIGVAVYPDDVATEDGLLELADDRMYQNKKLVNKK